MARIKKQRTKRDTNPPWEVNMKQYKNKRGKHPQFETFSLYGESSRVFFKIDRKSQRCTVSQQYDTESTPKVIHRRITKEQARFIWTTFTKMGWLTERDFNTIAGESAWVDQFRV